ncbi:hypothetical protein ABZ883_08545 [Streptomyces sp. NPDC046977]|uniref:hypothetical protein n=1 Tax=Streptomyces sp. NPDC046977 TaxID=3154703 RepID=UPI0033F8C016
MDAVLEIGDIADFGLWPVADVPAYRFLGLSPHLSALEVGATMATLTNYNAAASGNDTPAIDAVEQVRRVTEVERVIAPGGLRVRDTDSGAVVVPGCCSGLEDWREWLSLAGGDEPWLGHDPTPRVEHAGSLVRLWADSADAQPIEIPTADLLGMLQTVHTELSGFLSLVELWADRYVPALAPALAGKLAEDLDIGPPLG